MAEKNLSEISRPLREQYEKGLAAFQRRNFDYALTILGQVLQKEPAFFDCRQALRATQFKKSGGGSGFFKRLLGGASSSPVLAKAQMALRSNPLEAIQHCEQALNSDPSNAGAHKLLAEAALAADLPRTAVLSLEIVAKSAPKDRQVAWKLAHAYLAAGQVDKAEAIYLEMARTRPGDLDVAQALKDLAARRTMMEAGYETAGSYRDLLRDKEGAVALEQERREVKTEDVADRLIRDHEARLAREPDNANVMRSIAELYVQKMDFDRAIEYFRRMQGTEAGADPALDKIIIEVTLKKFDHQLEQLDPEAPDHAAESARVKQERDNFLLGHCKRRADRYPNDLQIRFELGELYFKTGRISEAIQEFQRSQAHPQRRMQSLLYLGRCFAARRMLDLALRTFQNALAEKQRFDDEKKELLYEYGCVLEQMGQVDEAIEQFKQIYEVDIGFRDVAAKVDAYYSGQG